MDKQRDLQIEINKAEVQVYMFNAKARRLMWHKRNGVDSISMARYDSLSDTAEYYELKKVNLLNKYDSLETQLKKYQ